MLVYMNRLVLPLPPPGHLLAGAIAGATSRTATAPLETLRLAAMAGQLQSRNLAQVGD